jgi:lipopolysaccharide transport system ATP-binding protein
MLKANRLSAPAIRVRNLSKQYQIGSAERGGNSFREAIAIAVRSPLERLRHLSGATPEAQTFWALRDISFIVEPGEVVGVIGHNGAGKSTLLKILSQITEPTSGRIEMNGRVGSLLEVGTGFHPELTGRENVFLNGAMLGMSRREIVRKFDEIVSFAEVEQFLDTPVKRYSSGMYMRLAFAVAAHLEPEILIIDEVLAVGDAEFQRRCLGRMEQLARNGRTVLFVSHNLSAIDRLCHSGIVLASGRIAFAGPKDDALREYHGVITGHDQVGQSSVFDARVDRVSRPLAIRSAKITSNGSYLATGYPAGAPLEIVLECTSANCDVYPACGIGIDDSQSNRITTLHTQYERNGTLRLVRNSDFTLQCRIANLPLVPGQYGIKLSLENMQAPSHVIERALTLTIVPSECGTKGGQYGRGVVLCRHQWELNTTKAI